MLLIAYDLPYPEPLLAVRPIREPLALALALRGEARAPALARWRLALEPGPAKIAPMPISQLASNPAAQALPLLAALARNESALQHVGLAGGCALAVETRP